MFRVLVVEIFTNPHGDVAPTGAGPFEDDLGVILVVYDLVDLGRAVPIQANFGWWR